MRTRLAAVCLAMCAPLAAQDSAWIWAQDSAQPDQESFFRNVFELPSAPRRARLAIACDNRFDAWVNGEHAAAGSTWEHPVHVDITANLHAGANVIAVAGRNDDGPAGLCARLDLELQDGAVVAVVSNAAWLATTTANGDAWRALDFDAVDWVPATVLGLVSAPTSPWPDVLAPRVATPIDDIRVADGFAVELLHSAQPGEGSWVCMTFDPAGRLIVSPQYGPLLRVTLPNSIEHLELGDDVIGAQGLAWAHDSLYAVISAPIERGGGLYRIRDRDGDDRFEDVARLKPFGPSGEHGPHAVVPGADGMLYLVHGNMTGMPEGVSPQSPHRNWAEDVLLAREWDPRGHAVGVRAPGGRVLRTDPDGRSWELIAAGMRNAYDIAFDRNGNLFTFDSDMEWDRGLPWYRPTRVLHIVAGGEYGWRSGSAKWPAHYLDSLDSVVDVGESSPTGIAFGYGSHFPARLRDALFLADWTKGRILAAHLTPRGTTFGGTVEDFVSGKPLNVTDLTFGPDGAMYFITGGRRTQTGLYRVRAIEPEAIAALTTAGVHQLAHASGDVDALWSELASDDRMRRYRARAALELLPIATWRERALRDKSPRVAIHAMLALARAGTASDRAAVLRLLAALDLDALDRANHLDALRSVAVACCRSDPLDDAQRDSLRAQFDRAYPSGDYELDRELGQVLAYCAAPELASRTMRLLRAATARDEQITHAMLLRNVAAGWTEELHRELFRWIRTAKAWDGGESLRGYIRSIERAALRHVADDALRAELAEATRAQDDTALDRAGERARDYTFTNWTLESLRPHLDGVAADRSFANGKSAFSELCARCHTFAGSGEGIGPDLTTVSRRFGRGDLLADILDPHRTVSDQYANTVITTTDNSGGGGGSVGGSSVASSGVASSSVDSSSVGSSIVVGRVVDLTDATLTVCIDPFTDRRVDIAIDTIVSRESSPYSWMPAGLLSTLSLEGVLDLLAYLESEGAEDDPRFRPR